ncbi:MAG: hypothetical protein O2807_12245 [bacterium]|nr:hypothetical protein [bacterium]
MIYTPADFDALLEMFRQETEGLTDAQLDWEDRAEEWSSWSVRRQISHVALALFFWIVKGWGKTLWPDNRPEDPVDFKKAAAYDRRLDEEKYWKMEDLWPKLEEAFSLVKRAAEGKSEEEMNRLTITRTFGSDLKMGETDLKVYAYWSYISTFHPDGLTQDPEDETSFTFTLAAMIRTLYWEALTHLRTIQRLKAAQGLPAAAKIPRAGYLLDPFFWGPEDAPRLHPDD